MHDVSAFQALTDEVATRFLASRGARGLVFVGSAADAARRDRWSDHDFLAMVDDGPAARSHVDWLPDPERLLFVAREGELGFSALYDDGHLLEFAVGSSEELGDVAITEPFLAFGGDEYRALLGERAGVSSSALPDAANETSLAYVKLLVGFGRARRGERIVAGQFVRCWAIRHLLAAARVRLPTAAVDVDPLEPARRFDAHHPEFAARLDAELAAPVEIAALGVARLARDVLEPGWDEFPSRAADVVIGILEAGDG